MVKSVGGAGVMETFLYVIGVSDPCDYVKIGISNHIHRRIAQLQPGYHSRLVVHYRLCFSSRANALVAESLVHDYLEDDRMCGEWFAVTPEDAVEFIWRCIGDHSIVEECYE
jgi:hypothetical protein